MSVIPCKQPPGFREKVEEIAELLKTQAHLIPGQALSEKDFYESGLFRAAIERIRGQNSAAMSVKREFARHVLNFLEDEGLIANWQSAGGANRFDYSITLKSGRIAVVELKGCLDGNNTNIFERPPQAHEFFIWSVCQNPGAAPDRNVWSGIHTRLGAEIINAEKQVDGLIVWDMVCGTVGRPLPEARRATEPPDRYWAIQTSSSLRLCVPVHNRESAKQSKSQSAFVRVVGVSSGPLPSVLMPTL